MFCFGGATYCLLLWLEVDVDFDFPGQAPGLKAKSVHVEAKIANVGRITFSYPKLWDSYKFIPHLTFSG